MRVCYDNYFVVISDITSILKKTPGRTELLDLLHDIRHKWYEIGLLLQARQDVLDDLKRNQEYNDEGKLFKVIDYLLTTQPSLVTLEKVINAVESPNINEKGTAGLIYHYIDTSKSNKLLILSNEDINSIFQTTLIKCIQFSLNPRCSHTMYIT